LKKVLIAFAVLGVLLIAAVLIGPSFIDWNAYKGQVVAAVRDNTGRNASIDGDIAFSVLPTPALRVAGVRIANFEGAQSPDMLRLKELRVRVSIAALLERRIEVEQLELIEPVIALEIAEDGRASWDIEPATAVSAQGEPAAVAQEPSEASAPLDISLANVTIRGGSLSFRDARSGTFETVEALQLAVSAPSLSGPFDLTADGRVRGIPVSIALKTGTLKPGQPLTVGLKLVLVDADAEARFNGSMLAPVPTGLLSGKLEIEGADAARLAAIGIKGPLPAILAQPVSLEGMLTVSPDAVELKDTAIRLGAVSGNGAVSVILGETINADIAVSVSRLDLDELLAAPVVAKTVAPVATAVSGSKPTPQKPPESSGEFSLPGNIAASLDIEIDVVQYRDGVIRDVGLRAALANGAVTLERASALLPGGSDVSLFGFLSFIEEGPWFEGEIAVGSDNLRALLGWAGADTASLPSDRLRGFSFASKVSAKPTSLEIPDINVRLDASTMTGGLAVALRERPGFGLRLAIDKLNLDAYMPRTATKKPVAAAAAKADKNVVDALAAAVAEDSPLAFLGSFDANIDIEIDRLIVQQAVARKVKFDGLLFGGALTIRKSGVRDFAGTRVDVSGEISDLSGTPSAKIDYSVAVNNPERLFRFLGTPLPIPLQKIGKPSSKGRLEGTVNDLKVNTSIVGAGTKIKLEGTIKNAATAPLLDMGVSVDHADLVKFVRLAVPGFRPTAKGLGALATTFRLNGTLENLRIMTLQAAAGPLNITGSAVFRNDGPRPFVSADLATSELSLDLFQPAPKRTTGTATARGRAAASASRRAAASAKGRAHERWSRKPIDSAGLGDIDGELKIRMAGLIRDRIRLAEPVLDVGLKNGQLDLRSFKAGLFGGAVSAKGTIDATSKTPVIAFDVTVADVDLATVLKNVDLLVPLVGQVSANASLKTTGRSVAALVSALGGSGRLTGKVQILATQREQQVIRAIDLAAVIFGNKVKELKQIGSLTSVLAEAFGRNPEDLSGTFAVDRGVVRTGDTVLNGAGTRALTVGAADLPRWLIDSTTSVLRRGDSAQSPYIAVTLSGPLDSPNVKMGGSFLSSGSTSSSNPLQQILPGILGSQSGSKKVEPQDVLRDLLKGLGR